ncbi:methionyl-tRNA formyltransferase, mitochondrial isoform X1 [Palaemon carinicauda]|uniref:methionyl-tRNA formyltransferase, mitochondrial isoform X1 n=1 Tax=Palaemon carinicauda TaxID=392227 RepID=UPI0035B599F7
MMGSLRIQSFHKTKILKLCPHQFGAINGQAKTFSSLVDEDYSKETRSSTSKVRLKPPWNVMFFGTDDFAVESLQALCKGRERKLIGKLDVITAPVKKTSPVLQFCKKENIQVIQWSAEVPKGTYDVGTVVSFGHLLPLAIIDAFPMGILNVHGSLLPRWRGAAPIIRAVMNNDEVTGVTIMEIQPHRFDVGRILRTAAVPIPWDIKSGALTKQLATLGARELIQVIESLPEVLEKAVEQSGKGVTKAPKVSENSSRIKWNTHTCRNIQARYRALDDYIPLWTTWQGIPVKLRKMEMHKEWSYPAESNGSDNFVSENKISRDSLSEKEVRNSSDSVICNKINLKDNVKPGTAVYDRTTKTVNVKCLDHWVSFSQVLLKGRKPMSAHEFYNGFMSKYPNKQLEFC